MLPPQYSATESISLPRFDVTLLKIGEGLSCRWGGNDNGLERGERGEIGEILQSLRSGRKGLVSGEMMIDGGGG